MTAHVNEPIKAPFRSSLTFVLGILSVLLDVICLGWIVGIPAWLMARRDLNKMSAGALPADQKGLTTAGMVLGIIGTFIWIPWIIFYFVY